MPDETPTYPLSEEGITAALRALGDDPDVIAETLRNGGFKGIRDDEGYCVIAAYCRRVLHDEHGRADVDEIYAWQGGVWVGWIETDDNFALDVDRRHFDYQPTPALAAFIEKFDKRQYPELIEEEERRADAAA